MTVKEICAYLKQVTDLEQQLMQLREVRDEISRHYFSYEKKIGSKPDYKMKRTYKDARDLVEWIDKPFVMASYSEVQERLFFDYYKRPKIDQNTVALLQEPPKPPVAVAKATHKSRSKILISGIVFALLFAFLAFAAGVPEYVLLFIPAIVFISWLVDCRFKVINKEADRYDDYLKQQAAYENAVIQRKQAEEAVVESLRLAYENTVEKASDAYQVFVLKRYEMLKEEYHKLGELIAECDLTLQKLYSQDVIHSKYHNMTACCMFLEYLETGRCNDLTGANGAYNLYESELRQNLIISKLDEVVDRLDALQATMYRCCQAIESVRKQMDVLHSDLRKLNDTAQKQLKLSALTTVYAAATAANTSAIKYLTLIN